MYEVEDKVTGAILFKADPDDPHKRIRDLESKVCNLEKEINYIKELIQFYIETDEKIV